MITESSDETARRVQRALVAVMSTGICVAAQDEADVEKFLGDCAQLLRYQVSRDFPKIKHMQKEGEVNSLILPTEKM